MKKAARLQCMLCNISFPWKSRLLKHMKVEHGILQPYQCIACLKRFSSGKTLCHHRRLHCRRKNEMGTYSFPSFIRGYHAYQKTWAPIFGDMLTCIPENDNKYDNTAVAVMYADKLAGHLPRSLSSTFSKFLSDGTITARISGIVVDQGYGLEIPVTYIFNGNRQSLYKLIASVENQ